MNTSAAHIAQAEHNEAFLQLVRGSAFPSGDWQVTLLFYAALHYVDAYLHQLQPSPGIHPRRHGERVRHVGLQLSPALAVDFLELQHCSEDARYDGRQFTPANVAALESAQFARIRAHIRTALALPL